MGLTGACAVPVTLSGGGGSDRIAVVGNIGQTGTSDASTTIGGDDGNDNLFAATPSPVTILGGTGDEVVDGGGAGVGREIVSLGDGNDLFRSSLNTFVGARSDIVDGGSGQDTLTVRGPAGIDRIAVSGSGAGITVAGLKPTVTPIFRQPTNVLRIETVGGNDVVDSSGLRPGLVQLQVL